MKWILVLLCTDIDSPAFDVMTVNSSGMLLSITHTGVTRFYYPEHLYLHYRVDVSSLRPTQSEVTSQVELLIYLFIYN